MHEHAGSGQAGLVLAGGGARGAYELGALSELLPRLPEAERPRVLVGTSVGAVNAAYLAATADEPLDQALARGCDMWLDMAHWESVFEPILSFAQLRVAARAAADALGFPGGHSWSLLDPSPLRRTLDGKIPFERIHENVASGEISAAAVVTTRASTALSVVFCDCVEQAPPTDRHRGIAYEKTARLSMEHVLASAAIPAAIPAVEVNDPPSARGWYFDGGTRLNTPIRPVLDLGADRIIVVALHAPRLIDAPGGSGRPQVLDGVSALMQGVLVDPLVNDVHTITTINRLVGESGAGTQFKQIPYILIAPEAPFEIGELAVRTFARHYRGARRRRGSVARVGSLLDVADSKSRGELLSYLFFDPDFIAELIELGRRDARRWLERPHNLGHWQTGPPD
jgi:NTE family protein